MNIYTKTGDKGTTSLFDNKRVPKDHIRVESYGTVDELVSFLGLAKNYMDDKEIFDLIQGIQNKLFIVASNLATEDKTKVKYHILEEDIKHLRIILMSTWKAREPYWFYSSWFWEKIWLSSHLSHYM